jgi:uncharacterized damage-inducible protein DinB
VVLSDHVRFGVAHGTWAWGRVIDSAAHLPTDAVERDLGIGPGGLRVTIAHAIEVMFFFAACFDGREYTEAPDFAERSATLEGLRGLLAEAHAALHDAMLGACSRGLTGPVAWPGGDVPFMPAEAAVAQVFDHATLHRAQCVNMLKRLGVLPLPDLDPMSYVAAGQPRQESTP